MKKFLGKVTTVIVGIIATLFGTSAANVAIHMPDLGSKKKALYLEHGKSINDNTRLLAEFGDGIHMSHVSRSMTQSPSQSQPEKVQKVAPVENKSKAVTTTQSDKTQIAKPVDEKAKAAAQTQNDAAIKTKPVENKAKTTLNK